MEVSSSASNGLNQAAFRPQESFFVGIQNGHQRNLWNVQAFAQQVDADQHIKCTQAQVAQNFYAFYRVDIGVQIPHLDTVVGQVVGQLLGHAFGEGCDEYALVLVNTNANFLQHIVHLVNGGSHFHLGVNQTCGPDHLLYHFACVGFFVIGGSGRHKNALTHFGFELFEFQRPIVQRTGQPEAVFHQSGFACAVAVVHGVELSNHLVALIQKHDGVERHVIGQGAWRSARFGARQMACVVFNAFAVTHFTQHF